MMDIIGMMTQGKSAASAAALRLERRLERNAAAAGNRRGARGYWDRPSRYDGAKLREIRARNGVGRPPKLHSLCVAARIGYGAYPAYAASFWGAPPPNLAEWLRKPRKMDRGA